MYVIYISTNDDNDNGDVDDIFLVLVFNILVVPPFLSNTHARFA